MCTKPPTIDGQQVSCGNCDECISARKRDWVARAMAEKTQHECCFAVTLTYADETQWQRDGAAMFRYKDVSDFLKRLRRSIEYKTGTKGSAVRFLCAGEKGDRFDRVHWHIILYTRIDIRDVGKWTKFGKPCRRDDIISDRETKLRRGWSTWGHGFVEVEIPDEIGMAYCLTYALKDQFTEEKSAGNKRQNNVERFATGLFRPSKSPPIGFGYVAAMLDDFEKNNTVLPHLRINIPELKGYWYPRGLMRRYILHRLFEINQGRRKATGRNAPQWKSLLAACKDNESDLEILLNGTEEPEETSIAHDIESRERQSKQHIRDKRTAERCGSTVPCNLCLASITEADLSSIGVDTYVANPGTKYASVYWKFAQDPHGDNLGRSQRDKKAGGINRFCQLKECPAQKRVFPRSAGGNAFDHQIARPNKKTGE